MGAILITKGDYMQNYTKEQLKAIEERGKDILVSAAAGSGKTTVLVERIIQKILKDKVNIDSLLVVTFTNAAANEMKERILLKIEQALEKDLENDFLKQQLIKINKAQISTIDSFCLKIVKDNFKEIDIEPNFRILDTQELDILKNEALESFLQKYYEDEDSLFFTVLEAFSTKVDDKKFKELFFNIYEQAQNDPYPKEWLEKCYDRYNIKTEEDFYNSKIFEKITEYAKEVLEDFLQIEQYVKKMLTGLENEEKKLLDFLNEEFLAIKNIYDFLLSNNYKNFYESFKNLKFKALRIKYLENNVLLKEDLKDIRNLYKKHIEDIQKKFFEKDIETILFENKKIFSIMQYFCNLIIQFEGYFLDIKKQKNAYTFNDISHFCLNILIDEKTKKHSLIANEYKKTYNEIIIDEYQDSNLIQEEILLSVSKNNRFMVGDIKQCIYRFRQANPDIFNAKYIGYKNNTLDGIRIDLNANFRSERNIIDGINFVFEKLMTYRLGEVCYDDFAKLKKITEDKNLHNLQKCQLHILECNIKDEDFEEDALYEELQNLNNMETEAHYIAKKIIEIIDEKQYNYKDIAILSRNNSFAKILSKVFLEYNIPIFAKNNNEFFEIIEISTILNILKIIDNPFQDIPLIAVMYSPIFDFGANELLKIKIYGKSKLFYDCILNYIKAENEFKELDILEKLTNLLEKITKWKSLSKELSINELLNYIYKDSNYYNYVSLLENGVLRQANLFNLIERAITFEKVSLNGIFGFINYIEKIKDLGSKSGEANISQNENTVKFMTIHKSKGLEFPIVFLSNISTQFNKKDTNDAILFDLEYNLGVSLKLKKEEEDFFRYNIDSIQKSIIKEKINREIYSEEIRVLYVALTRAKHQLILTSTIKKDTDSYLAKIEKRIISSNILKEKLILSSFLTKGRISYLEWLYAIIKNFENTTWELFLQKKEDILANSIQAVLKEDFKTNFEYFLSLDKNEKYSNHFDFINKNLNWKYSFEIEKNLESSITVSEIKRKLHNEILEDSYFNKNSMEDSFNNFKYNLPKFYKQKEEISAQRRGTIYHTILEHLDFNISTIKELELFIENMQKRGFIAEEEQNILDTNKIFKFLNSNLVKRIKKSKYIKKEMPFKLALTPYEIYKLEKFKKTDALIIVNGIIDLFFEEDDKIIIVDYKTDKYANDKLLKQRYKIQMDIYKKAIISATGKEVKECILYLIMQEKERVI